MYKNIIKPFFDRSMALIAFLVTMPLTLVIMILLFLFQKGQVIFVQERPGYKERIIKVIKFKTMTDDKDVNGNLLPDEERLTRIGNFVRRLSLDELPQLINVIRGDMSFVGPRPWLVKYLNLYTEEQKKRHLVKPGISGWAQIHGRNELDWDERFKYDLFYVDNQSFKLDLEIIYLTIYRVLGAKGVNPKGRKSMDEFKGTK